MDAEVGVDMAARRDPVPPEAEAGAGAARGTWVAPKPPRVTATEWLAWITYLGVLGALIAEAVTTRHPSLGTAASFVVWLGGVAILGWYYRSGTLRTPEVVLQREPLPFPFADDEPVGIWLKAGAIGNPQDILPAPEVDAETLSGDAGLDRYLMRAEQARRRREQARQQIQPLAGAPRPGSEASPPPS